MNACFLAPIFTSGENFSFFLAMDDFEPIVGGVYNICDDFFGDGGVADDIADDIDDVGVTFDGRVDVDPIDDGDVDDEVDTAVFSSVNDMFRRSVELGLRGHSKRGNMLVAVHPIRPLKPWDARTIGNAELGGLMILKKSCIKIKILILFGSKKWMRKINIIQTIVWMKMIFICGRHFLQIRKNGMKEK